jgi:hypothetical protein
MHGFVATDTDFHTFGAELRGLRRSQRSFDFYSGEKLMPKHLQNLERIYQKLRFRYGQDDDLVMQVKHEIESNVTKHSKNNPSQNQGQLWELNEEFHPAPMSN